jgi:hypothetical protein
MKTSGSALKDLVWVFITTLLICSARAGPAPSGYDLNRTDGINCFGGSTEAQELLAKQGFVVAAPEFIQIFQAYIESPLPVFVTPDSAWHTYHVVVEEGVKEMERAQGRRMAEFSRRLLKAAQVQATNGPQFEAIATYAAIGLAFQEKECRDDLPADQKRLVENLLNGEEPVPSPIGFPLSPVQFRAQSFYTESADLEEFYSAHQWYGMVDFRLSEARETTLALCLSWLIESDPELLDLWKRLTEPYDLFVAAPEDGSVTLYNRTGRSLLANEFGPQGISAHISTLQKRLDAALPDARINDQYLSPDEYARFPKLTKGFRLLLGRQLPCQACFQSTVDPAIPGRMFPSGLDFMAASAVMRSPAAVRAVEAQFGKAVAEAIQKADCPPMPNTLYGRSMELLAKLQERLQSPGPEPLQTEAWADLQLWTQLAAWSEQRHTWALYAKNGALYGGDAEPPPGVVAPYPAFFAGLARLSRETAKAFENTTPEQSLDPKRTAAEMLQMQTLFLNNYDGMSKSELARISDKTGHHDRFITQFYAKHQSELNNPRSLNNALTEMLNRVAATGVADATDMETLKMYFDTRLVSAPQLISFAGICDRLAEFAQKELQGKPLDHDEAKWLRNYGKFIAGFQGYGGNSWLVPLDDFSLVTRIFDNPLKRSVLYAGVARPQALYVVLPYKGKLQLYRGAVLSYREFVRSENDRLDDKAWRAMVAQGQAPAPPVFTRSFLRTDKPDLKQKKLGFVGSTNLKPGEPRKIRIEVQEVSLGPSPKEWVRHEGWITPSEDCRHVAYRARNGGKWRIFRDGASGKEYDEASYQWFSPDSEHLAYLARSGEKYCVVLDGTEGEFFNRIVETSKHQWPFVFSPDSARLAYVANCEGKQCVVVDGNRGPAFGEVLHHSFSFSEDSKHFAYAGRRDGKGIVVKDGKEVLQAEAVFSPVQAFGDARVGDTFGPFLSPDGARLAAAISRAGKWIMVVDGAESQPWDSISYLNLDGPAVGFSPDGQHFSYVGMRGDKHSAVVDDKENAGSWFYCAVFSPDSKHFAFVRGPQDEQKMVSSVVLDGIAGKEFAGEAKRLVFSPDGKKLAYKVSEWPANEYVVLHGGEEYDDYSADGDIIFSPDSQHMAFRGSKNGQSFMVIDGHEYLKSDSPHADIHSDYFTFTPDSERWGYIVQRGDQHYAMISGATYGPYDYLSVPDEEAYIYFSPDSRHFAFMAARDYIRNNYRDGRQYLVVDGRDYEIQGASWLSGSVLRFDSPTKLHGLIMGTDRIARLEVEIKPDGDR